jgi:PKD repeat protein
MDMKRWKITEFALIPVFTILAIGVGSIVGVALDSSSLFMVGRIQGSAQVISSSGETGGSIEALYSGALDPMEPSAESAGSTAPVIDEREQNERPVASFDASSFFASEGESIHFVDTSSDEDGEIVAWLWTFGDNTHAYEPNPQHTYAEDGEYVVTLYSVDDGGMISASATATIVVSNAMPVASFSIEESSGTSVWFANRSMDPSLDGEIVHIGWDFGDGTTLTGDPAAICCYEHTYSAPGTYLVTLYVIDNEGGMSVARETIVVG